MNPQTPQSEGWSLVRIIITALVGAAFLSLFFFVVIRPHRPEIVETAPKAIGPPGTLNIPKLHEQRIQEIISESKEKKAVAEKMEIDEVEKEAEQKKILEPRIGTLKRIASCSDNNRDPNCNTSIEALAQDGDIVLALKQLSENNVKIGIHGYSANVDTPIFLNSRGGLEITAVYPISKIRKFLGLTPTKE